VLAAFNDIEVSLGNIELLEALGVVAAEDLERAEESFRIAEARYREGVADYQTVLISQNQLFSSRNAFLDNKLARLNASIALYQALGGGWQSGIASR
jgi:outer membrane protein TolC